MQVTVKKYFRSDFKAWFWCKGPETEKRAVGVPTLYNTFKSINEYYSMLLKKIMQNFSNLSSSEQKAFEEKSLSLAFLWTEREILPVLRNRGSGSWNSATFTNFSPDEELLRALFKELMTAQTFCIRSCWFTQMLIMFHHLWHIHTAGQIRNWKSQLILLRPEIRECVHQLHSTSAKTGYFINPSTHQDTDPADLLEKDVKIPRAVVHSWRTLDSV